jgi:hypothetical protein
LFLKKKEYKDNRKYQKFIQSLHKKLSRQPKAKEKGYYLRSSKNNSKFKDQNFIILALNARKRRALTATKVKRLRVKESILKRYRQLNLQVRSRIISNVGK